MSRSGASTSSAAARSSLAFIANGRRLINFNPPGRAQNKKRRPIVPMSNELYPFLRYAIEHVKGEYVLGHGGSVRKAFESAVARAGLADVTPHTLRHALATWMAQAGVPLWEIAGVLGDTLATVERNYAHHAPDYARAAVNFRDRSGGVNGK